MYILLEACQNPTILRVVYFGYLLFDVVTVAIPVGLILMLMIDFTKAVVTNDDNAISKINNIIIKRIIYAVIIFAIPWIVSVVMQICSSVGLNIGEDYNKCITIVKSDSFDISVYDDAQEAEEAAEKSEITSNINSKSSEEVTEYRETKNSAKTPSSDATLTAAAKTLISKAKGEVGKTDGTAYGASSGQAWCAYFVSYMLSNTYVNLSSGKTSLYDYINEKGLSVGKGQASGLWPNFADYNNNKLALRLSKNYGGDYIPKAGDIVWFWYTPSISSSYHYCWDHHGGAWNGTVRCADHVGLVEKVENGYVYTIEGNSGGKVSENKYPLNYAGFSNFGSWYS